MSEWTPQRVLDAAAATEFVPEGAIEVRTNDYRLLRHPDWVLGPSLGAAQVTWSRTARPLDEVIVSIPGMLENTLSSGVATADAMVSGFAPGRDAVTSKVGKSTLGRSLTASER